MAARNVAIVPKSAASSQYDTYSPFFGQSSVDNFEHQVSANARPPL